MSFLIAKGICEVKLMGLNFNYNRDSWHGFKNFHILTESRKAATLPRGPLQRVNLCEKG